jgi:hypothetical protein
MQRDVKLATRLPTPAKGQYFKNVSRAKLAAKKHD